MEKLKIFWRTFVNSLTKPSYYKDILQAKFSFSLKYLAFLLFLISLVGALKFTFGLLDLKPKLPEFIDKAKIVVMNVYPDKLIITVKGGKISTNVKEPYFIEMPEEVRDLGLISKNLVAIDTQGNVEDFEKYDSTILLTDEFAVLNDYQSGRPGYKVNPLKDYLKDVPDGVQMNKAVYQTFANQVLPYIDKLPQYLMGLSLILIILMPFLGALLTLSGYMLYLILPVFILWIISKLMKKGLAYGKVFQLSMHGLTLPILISALITLYGKSFPFLFSIIFFGFMIFVLSRIPGKLNKSS